MPNPNWVKGVSGNPAGRPKKDRALTDILEKAGKRSVEIEGQKVAKNRFLAAAVWQAVTEKQVTLPTGEIIELRTDEWWEAVKFIYRHIDGPPRAGLDVTTNGRALNWKDFIDGEGSPDAGPDSE